MSYLLPHLHSGFSVDQAILAVRPTDAPRWLHGVPPLQITGMSHMHV